MKDSSSDDRVLIVGAGPTGATLALCLAKLGVPSAIVEKRLQPQRHPAASILNTRTMEIFRYLDLESHIVADCQDVFSRSNITWATSLAGKCLGRLSAVQEDLEQQLALSPTHTFHYPQHRLEPELWKRVENEALIEFLPGFHCNGFDQSSQWVDATVNSAEDQTTRALRGRYLVACDGADSPLRQRLGIGFSGPLLQNMMGIHFEADLGDIVRDQSSILYWIFNPDLLGVLIAHWFPTEWVLFFPYFPPQQDVSQFDRPVAVQKILDAVGVSTIPDLKLHKTLPWAMTARLADDFQRGRIFLAGDAAHSFPPTGGLGLNTGVQDAHNLAWKLAAVVKKNATEALLPTYQTERRPIAQLNLQHSTRNYRTMSDLTKVVGVDFAHLEKLRHIQSSHWFGALPSALQQRSVNWVVKSALRRFDRLDSDSASGHRARARFAARLNGQIPHYRSLGLDLGFRYEKGCVFGVDEANSDVDDSTSVDDLTRYEPALKLGGRFPHFPIEQSNEGKSSLDLVPTSGFLLLTTTRHKAAWESAIAEGVVPHKIVGDLPCLSIGNDASADVIDEEDRWSDLLGDIVAVLLRPDGHIAWLPRSVPRIQCEALLRYY